MSRPTTAIATDEVLDMDLLENTSDEDDGFGACTPAAASSFQGYNDGTCSTADAATDDVEGVTGTAATDGMEAVTGTLMDADGNKSTTPPTLTEIWDALPDRIRRKFNAWGLGLGHGKVGGSHRACPAHTSGLSQNGGSPYGAAGHGLH